MDRQYIENEHIVERYLSGDLTVCEAGEFQRFCCAHPELIDDWPISAAVRAQLKHQPQSIDTADTEPQPNDLVDGTRDAAIYTDVRPGYTDLQPSEGPPPRLWRGIWSHSPKLLSGLVIALLAAVAGLIGVALHAHTLNQQLQSLTREKLASELQAHSTVRAYRVKLVRGRPQKPTVSVGWPMPPELVDMYIDVTEGNYTSFQLTIDRIDGSRVLQIRRIARDSNRELRLALNSSAFGPGEYLMKIDGYTWRGELQESGLDHAWAAVTEASPHFSQGGSACGGKVLISEHFHRFCEATVAVHAEPIAALAALKLASLALQSTHSPRYGQISLKRASRAARDKLDSTHHSRSL